MSSYNDDSETHSYFLSVIKKIMYSIIIGIVALISGSLSASVSTCESLINTQCDEGAQQCCSTVTEPNSGTFVICTENYFVLSTCGDSAYCNPFGSGTQCVPLRTWFSQVHRYVWICLTVAITPRAMKDGNKSSNWPHVSLLSKLYYNENYKFTQSKPLNLLTQQLELLPVYTWEAW